MAATCQGHRGVISRCQVKDMKIVLDKKCLSHQNFAVNGQVVPADLSPPQPQGLPYFPRRPFFLPEGEREQNFEQEFFAI